MVPNAHCQTHMHSHICILFLILDYLQKKQMVQHITLLKKVLFLGCCPRGAKLQLVLLVLDQTRCGHTGTVPYTEPPREAAELLFQGASSSPKRHPQQSSQASPCGEILNRNPKIGRNAAGMEMCTCEEARAEAAEQGLPEQPVLITRTPFPRRCSHAAAPGRISEECTGYGTTTGSTPSSGNRGGGAWSGEDPALAASEPAAAGRAVRLCCPPRTQRRPSSGERQGASTPGALPAAAGPSRRASQVLHALFRQALPLRVLTEPCTRSAVPAALTGTITIVFLQTASQNAETRDSRSTGLEKTVLEKSFVFFKNLKNWLPGH